MVNSEISLNDNYTLFWASDKEVRELATFYNAYMGEDGYAYHSSPRNLIKGLDDYRREIILRGKLLYYKEDFFLIRNEEKQNVGVVSAINYQPNTEIMEINTYLMPCQIESDALNGIIRMYREHYDSKVNKLRMRILSTQLTETKDNVLVANEFNITAVLKNEYPSNADLFVYDYLFQSQQVHTVKSYTSVLNYIMLNKRLL